MKMPANPFAAALKSGRKSVGLWVSLANAQAAEVVASAGYDWLCLDMEHTAATEAEVVGQLQAVAPFGPCIVRPPWNDFVTVKRLMDMGAPGLLFPMVQSVDEAQAAVAATRYPPHGIRGFAGLTRANQFGRMTDYLDRVDEETVVILQVESRQAMDRAVEIGSVDGVDGVFFGPADIAADLGYLGQPNAPEVWEAIMPVAHKLMAANIPVGTLVLDPARAAQLLNEGFTFVACGTDVGLLARAADAALQQVRTGLIGED